ncbi:MAG: dihydroneopterin aldolase [Puniceicoccaceae bacterium]
MADSIFLKNLVFHARHGVLPSESQLGQRFEIDLRIYLDLRLAGQGDDLLQTVDYSLVYHLIQEIVENRRFQLIEGLAHAIATEVLVQHPRIQTVAITVRKPSAPIPGIFDFVAVELIRSRDP